MPTISKDHKLNEDIYLGYDPQETKPNPILVNYRNNIPFSNSKINDPENLIINISNTNINSCSPDDFQIIADIFYLIGVPTSFIKLLEDYIKNIDYPYRFRDIKILKIYKKICKKYDFKENTGIYHKILNDNRKCDCVIAIKSVLSDKFKKLDTKNLISCLDLVTKKDKHKIMKILGKKDFDPEIFNTNTIYEVEFLNYLARFIYNLHLQNKSILKIKLKVPHEKILNYDLFLDYVLTLDIEENRKMIKLKRLFRKNEINILQLLLFQNLSKSIFILRSEFVKFPITEILLDTLLKRRVLKCEMPFELKTDFVKIALNVLTNLLLEFGNYRSVFTSMGGLDIIEKYKFEYPIEVLRIYKNYLYDNTIQIKQDFLRNGDNWFLYFFNLHTNFDNLQTNFDNPQTNFDHPQTNFDNPQINFDNPQINFDNPQINFDNPQINFEEVKEVLFNLIRNLVCDKIDLSDYIINKIFIHLLDTNSANTLVHILYSIANILANNVKFRDMVLNREGILMRFKELFNIEDLQLPLVWIIINLTWRDFGFEERVKILNNFRFREDILNISTSDSELIDKMHTALDNLRILSEEEI